MAVDNNPPADDPKAPAPLTIDQIQESVKGNPEFGQKLTNAILQSDLGRIALNNHLSTHKSLVKGDYVGEGYKGAMTEVDAALEELMGSKKPDGIKTTDWLKTALAKSVNADTGADEASKQLIDQMSKDNKELKKTLEAQKLASQQQMSELKQQGLFSSAINKINWQPDIDSDLLFGEFGAITNHVNDLIANAKEINGVIVYMDGDEVIMNAEMKPATASEVLEIKFSKFVHTPQAGGGAGNPPANPNAPTDKTLGVDISSARNRAEAVSLVQAYLKKEGIEEHTKEGMEVAAKLIKDPAYLKLPRQ